MHNKNYNIKVAFCCNENLMKCLEEVKAFLGFKYYSLNNEKTNFLDKGYDLLVVDLGYKKLDVFVLPSINSFEAFGIVQLEAMSYGVPVIATNIKGVRSIILNTGNGYLFEKNNYKQLAEMVIKIRDTKLKNTQDILNDTQNYYGYDLFLNRISKMFKFF